MATERHGDKHRDILGSMRRPSPSVVARAVLVAAGTGLLAACTSAAGSSFSPVAAVPGADGAVFNGVGSTPTGFVVVGSVPVAGEQGHAAAWTSTDGSTWARATDDPSFSGQVMLSVASGRGGLMAVGSQCWTSECGENAIWTSVDGTTWRGSPGIAPNTDFSAVTETVVAGGPGWILGGRENPTAMGSKLQPGIWTSADGQSFAVATLALPPGATNLAGAVAGLAIGGGEDVAVGTLQTDTGHGAAAWTSTDGKAWSLAADDGSFAGSVISGVVAGGPGFVAVGRDDNGAAVWDSTNGSSWNKVSAGPGFTGARMTAVGAGGDRIIATGEDGNSALAWTSKDGETWTQVATGSDAAGMQASGAAVDQTADVIVGGVSGTPRIWTATP